MAEGKRILIAALNWGLGHASRCVPLIKALQDLGYEVIIASDGQALNLLKANFPSLPIFELPELKVNYSSKRGAVVSVLSQFPKLNRYIRKEKKLLNEYLKNNHVDLIISDNRYGIYHEDIPSVVITHQLKVKLPMASSISAELIKARLKYFNECWVPDDDQHSLSAELSSSSLPIPKVSIGSLSQFNGLAIEKSDQAKNEILVILSGPEPARTIFEKKLIIQAEEKKMRLLIVKGMQGNSTTSVEYVQFKDQITAQELGSLILSHERIICRSGFSSIMDLCCLEKQALLVPTPGQAEQVYLATYHKDRGNFYSVREKDLDIERDLAIAYGGDFKPRKSCMEYAKQKALLKVRLDMLMQ